MGGRGLCAGFCHPCGQSQSCASQPPGTLPPRWSAELAVPCALGMGQQLLWGARATGSQQAAVPWHQGALSLSCVGTGPRVTHSSGSVPQQGLALYSQGGGHSTHGWAHVPVGTSGAQTPVPGLPKIQLSVGTPQHPILTGYCCLSQHLAWTDKPLLHCCACPTHTLLLQPGPCPAWLLSILSYTGTPIKYSSAQMSTQLQHSVRKARAVKCEANAALCPHRQNNNTNTGTGSFLKLNFFCLFHLFLWKNSYL